MIFEKIGKFVVKNRWWILGFWLILVLVMVFAAPSLSQVGTTDEASFLPIETESVKARDLIKEKFPQEQALGTGVVVFYNEKGLTEKDKTFAKEISQYLTSDKKPKEVKEITSIFNKPEAKSLLTSTDNTTMLIQVNFDALSFDKNTSEAVEKIREKLKNAPENLQVHFTGPAGIGADLSDTIKQSIDVTTIATIILVIILLLLIYRSPVASFVPLITITAAFIIAKGTLGFLAESGWKISSMLDSFLIVLIFGAGTDYCLFIVSRLREELGKGNHKHEAVAQTMSKIGAVITASAATVIVGFLGLLIASFGMVKTIGPALAIAIGITLLASLTLTPAIMSIFGHKLFWPFPEVEKPHKALLLDWEKIAKFVTSYAKMIVPVVIILLLVPYLKLSDMNKSFDILSEMPKDKDSTQGFEVLKGHFDQGEVMPLNILIKSEDKKMNSSSSLLALSKITQELSGVEGVGKVKSLVAPAGEINKSPFLVQNQLQSFKEQINQANQNLGTSSGTNQIKPDTFKLFSSYFDELAKTYPEVKNNRDFQEIQTGLTSLSIKMQNISNLPQGMNLPPSGLYQIKLALDNLKGNIENLQSFFAEKKTAFLYPKSLTSKDSPLGKLVELFISADSTTTQLYVVLEQDPYSNQAFTIVEAVREKLLQAIADSKLSDSQGFVGGPTAEFADIQKTINKDFNRVMIVVIVGVLAVLILLLRSLIAPLYLMATVLLGYGATLGIVTWLFQDVLGQGGISYMIPVLLFVLLIALGADYNIFLSSRIREESEKVGCQLGVREASTRTGAIITACGLILAGTFGTLVFAPLQTLFQVGVAVGIGILLDTFIIRAILVPAIASLLDKWNWWPAKIKKIVS